MFWPELSRKKTEDRLGIKYYKIGKNILFCFLTKEFFKMVASYTLCVSLGLRNVAIVALMILTQLDAMSGKFHDDDVYYIKDKRFVGNMKSVTYKQNMLSLFIVLYAPVPWSDSGINVSTLFFK